MMAGSGRGVGLAGIGIVAGVVLVTAIFGGSDLLEWAHSTVNGTTRRVADVPAAAKPEDLGEASKPDATGERAAVDPGAGSGASPEAPAVAGRDGKADAVPDETAGSEQGSPSLDIVRVEPGGDIVVAGRAAPNATVEVLRDDKPIARGSADANGAFAIVPPPLPSGSSEITLRATEKDGTSKPGKESVAVVVDKQRAAKPLVAVSEPNKPTRVLSQPEAPAQATAGAALPDTNGAKTAKPEPTGSDTRMGGTAQPQPGKSDVAGSKPAEPGTAKSDAAKPDAAKPDAAKSDTAKSDTAKSDAAKPDRVASDAGRSEVARPEPASKSPATAAAREKPGAAGEAVPVRIVSIDAQEGGRLFVSGQGMPGAMLRLYLNDTLVAAGRAGADGRIAFTIGRGVQPGNYQVRIDQVDPETGKVAARAQVGFGFPVQFAAREGAGLRPTESPASSPQSSPAPVPQPPPATALALPPTADRAGQDAGTSAGRAGDGQTEDDSERAGATATRPPGPASVPGQARTAAGEAGIGRAEADGSGSGATPGAGTAVSGAVFVPEISVAKIVRGDSLWQISRRSYGDGKRFTVIYDANRDQIRNPNLIYPGQIFVMPADQPDVGAPGAKRG